jgi:nucleotide-binding universal stress UspA family protein
MSDGHSMDQRRVVVGVDGSLHSEQALRWGAFFAGTIGGRVDAVTAWQYPTAYGWAAPPPTDWDPSRDMDGVVRDTVQKAFGGHPPVAIEILVREGGAAPVLLEACDGAVMLVVGSRGHGGFVGLLLGSVSASVAEHASCPVLIVHGDEEPPPALPRT